MNTNMKIGLSGIAVLFAFWFFKEEPNQASAVDIQYCIETVEYNPNPNPVINTITTAVVGKNMDEKKREISITRVVGGRAAALMVQELGYKGMLSITKELNQFYPDWRDWDKNLEFTAAACIIFAVESAGTFKPDIHGYTNDDVIGLWQVSSATRKDLGISKEKWKTMTPAEQAAVYVKWLSKLRTAAESRGLYYNYGDPGVLMGFQLQPTLMKNGYWDKKCKCHKKQTTISRKSSVIQANPKLKTGDGKAITIKSARENLYLAVQKMPLE